MECTIRTAIYLHRHAQVQQVSMVVPTTTMATTITPTTARVSIPQAEKMCGTLYDVCTRAGQSRWVAQGLIPGLVTHLYSPPCLTPFCMHISLSLSICLSIYPSVSLSLSLCRIHSLTHSFISRLEQPSREQQPTRSREDSAPTASLSVSHLA